MASREKASPLPESIRIELERYIRTHGVGETETTFGLTARTVLSAALGLRVHNGTAAQIRDVMAGLRSAGNVTARAREMIRHGVDATTAYERANREVTGR